MTAPTQVSKGTARPRRASRWLHVALVVLVAFLALAIYHRNRLRAYWWAHRLVGTEELGARGYYIASLAAVGEEATGAIERLARDEDPKVRALAIFPLKLLPQAVALRGLARLLNDPNVDVRESAALALVFMSSAKAREVLRRTAGSPQTGAAAAVAALGRSDSPNDLETLCRTLTQHPTPVVRAQAAESLAARLLEDERLREPEDSRPGSVACDPFLALVRSLADDAAFPGQLALEREVAAAAQFVRRRGMAAHGADRPITPSALLRRTVADIAAKGLSTLTGRPVTPMADQSAQQQVVFADRCRRWFLQHHRPPPADRQNPQSDPAGSSDTSTGRPAEAPRVAVRNGFSSHGASPARGRPEVFRVCTVSHDLHLDCTRHGLLESAQRIAPSSDHPLRDHRLVDLHHRVSLIIGPLLVHGDLGEWSRRHRGFFRYIH